MKKMKNKAKNKTIQTKDDLFEQWFAKAEDYLTTTHNPPVEKNDEPDHFVEEHNAKVAAKEAEAKFKVHLVFSIVFSVYGGILFYFEENCGIIATLIITYFLFCLMFICCENRFK